MATTAWPNIVSALINQLRNASALSGVRIFDGIEIDESFPGDAVAVGHDGSEDGDLNAGSWTQTFQQLGNMKQFEDGTVNCVLWSQNGTTDLASRRTAAFALQSAVDTAIRADSSIGGTCLYSTVSSGDPVYRQTSQGAAVLINFTVTYRART